MFIICLHQVFPQGSNRTNITYYTLKIACVCLIFACSYSLSHPFSFTILHMYIYSNSLPLPSLTFYVPPPSFARFCDTRISSYFVKLLSLMENNKGLRKAKQPCSLELNGSKKYLLSQGNSGFYNLFQSRRNTPAGVRVHLQTS